MSFSAMEFMNFDMDTTKHRISNNPRVHDTEVAETLCVILSEGDHSAHSEGSSLSEALPLEPSISTNKKPSI